MSSIDKSNLDNLKNFFSNRNKEAKNDQDDIILIIGEHLQKIEQSRLNEDDKFNFKNQLTNLGTFLKIYNKNYAIKESGRKSPDFILTKKKASINLYLVEIQTNVELKNNEEYIETLFDEIEKEISSKNDGIKGVFNINLNDKSFNSAHRDDLKAMIINGLALEQKENLYIKSIIKNEVDGFHLFNSTTRQSQQLKHEDIQTYINTNEQSLVEHNNSENWLLLYFGGVQNSYDFNGIEPSVLTSKFESKFDSILLFDQINTKVYTLK
jgi:hypothetical protein